MRLTKSLWVSGLALSGLLAACGSSTGIYGGGGTSPTASSTPSSPSPSSSPIVKTASATVAGKSATILANQQGMTLYYFVPDTSTKIACSGGCASVWPPLLASSDAAISGITLSGTLSLLDGANGKQVLYNGHPLYTYSRDSAPGDTRGEGIAGKWHVATMDLAAAVAPTTSSSGYSY